MLSARGAAKNPRPIILSDRRERRISSRSATSDQREILRRFAPQDDSLLGRTPGLFPSYRIESLLWQHGVGSIAGLDEAGRGAWAGPVVAAAVVLPNEPNVLQDLIAPSESRKNHRFPGVRDSKTLSRAHRARGDHAIRKVALGVGIGVVPPCVVDELGLAFAGQLAFWRAVRALPFGPDHLLVDGFPLWSPCYRQAAVVDGDARCISIAAASIVAKVARDRIMAGLEQEAPGYGFAHNCGYGTQEHAQALRRQGPSPHHRRSYRPVAAACASSHG